MAWNPKKTWEEQVSDPAKRAGDGAKGQWDSFTGKKSKRHNANTQQQNMEASQQEMDRVQATRPEYNSIRDSNGKLNSAYQMDSPINMRAGKATDVDSENTFLNRGFLDQMREDGLRKPGEDSVWRQLQQGKINRQAGDVQGNLQNSQASALDAAAMRGGVGAGARERIAGQGVRDNLVAQQQTYGLGLDADIADENRRGQALQTLGAAEMGVAGMDLQNQQFNIGNQLANQKFNIGNKMSADQFNIGNTMSTDRFNKTAALGDVTQERMFDMGLYSEQMKSAAAKNLGAAAPASGGGKK